MLNILNISTGENCYAYPFDGSLGCTPPCAMVRGINLPNHEREFEIYNYGTDSYERGKFRDILVFDGHFQIVDKETFISKYKIDMGDISFSDDYMDKYVPKIAKSIKGCRVDKVVDIARNENEAFYKVEVLNRNLTLVERDGTFILSKFRSEEYSCGGIAILCTSSIQEVWR